MAGFIIIDANIYCVFANCKLQIIVYYNYNYIYTIASFSYFDFIFLFLKMFFLQTGRQKTIEEVSMI